MNCTLLVYIDCQATACSNYFRYTPYLFTTFFIILNTDLNKTKNI